MGDNRHLFRKDVEDCVKEIFQGNCHFCNHYVIYGIDPKSDTGNTKLDDRFPVGSRFYLPMKVSVGFKSLLENMDSDGLVRDKDAILAIFQAFHESAHVWQYSVAYMQEGDSVSPDIKDMARDRAMGLWSSDFKNMMYVLDSSELFANKYALQRIKPFFDEKVKEDSRFADIDLDGVLCNMFSNTHGPTWKDVYKCNTIDDLYKVFSDACTVAPFRKKLSLEYLLSLRERERTTDEFLHNTGISTDVSDVDNGYRETEILCKYIGENHPDCFRSLVCIQNDYLFDNKRNLKEAKIRKKMKVVPQEWVELADLSDIGQDDIVKSPADD